MVVDINSIIQKALAKGISMDKIQGAATATNQQTGSNIQIPSKTSQPLNAPTSMPTNAPTGMPIKGPTSIDKTTGVVNYGDLGGASKVSGTTTPQSFTQPVKAPEQFAFGQGASALEQQQKGYITQRNDYLAQEFLKQGATDTTSILDKLGQTYGDFQTANEQDKLNTAQAIANRIGEMQAQQTGTPTDMGTTPPSTTPSYIENLDKITENEVERGIQDYLQEVKRAGEIGLDRPVEDIERNKMLQERALNRAIEQTRFSINNQIEDVARQADQTVAMSDKIGALKGFGRSSGYIQGIQNIKDEADRTIGRLQQQLAFAEQYTGEDKAQIMADFNQDMKRVKEDFNFQMREIMDLGKIDLNTLTEKYGLSDDKLGNKIDSITFDVLQKREDLLNSYIQNTRSTIAIANDQINVLQNYDNWLGQQRERFTSIINMDGGAALSSMTYSQIDQAVKDGSLAPEQAVAYKQLMVGKSINTLASMGNPTQDDITNLMTAVQGGMSPAAALMQIVSSNPDRYQQAQLDWKPVPGMTGMFYATGPDGNPIFSNAPDQTQQPTQQPSGVIQQVTLNNKNVGLDSIAAPSIQVAFQQIQSQGLGNLIVGQGHRDQVETIKSMASRYGIPYNATNPAQTAAALRAAGHQVADPGMSKHETGMAIDLYSEGMKAPTAEQVKVLNDNGWFQTAGAGDMGHFEYLGKKTGGTSISNTDISTYNSSTFKPQTDLKTPQDKAKYAEFLTQKEQVMSNKDADIFDILKYSSGGKDMTDASIKSLEKYGSALEQLGTIQEQIKKMDTGPVVGKLRNLNPYDTDAQVLKAQLTALIPNLARGVYGEVGVLTDNDIRLYSQTIPNLTATSDVNKAILAMTLKVVSGGYKRQLQSLAAAGKDVSGFAGLYENILGQVQSLESDIGINTTNGTGGETFNEYQGR